MNILEHIRANHYDRDPLGRALVPTVGGGVATICATDKPGKYCILGWLPTPALVGSIDFAWTADGAVTRAADSACDLLPPKEARS